MIWMHNYFSRHKLIKWGWFSHIKTHFAMWSMKQTTACFIHPNELYEQMLVSLCLSLCLSHPLIRSYSFLTQSVFDFLALLAVFLIAVNCWEMVSRVCAVMRSVRGDWTTFLYSSSSFVAYLVQSTLPLSPSLRTWEMGCIVKKMEREWPYSILSPLPIDYISSFLPTHN